MIGPYNESNKYRLEQEIAALRAQVAELRGPDYDFGACVRQVLEIDRLRAEIALLHAELASARTVERKDLHEQISAAQAEAGALREALRDSETMFALAVLAAGGEIRVEYESLLLGLNDLELHRMKGPNREIIYLARRRAAQPAATGEGDNRG